MIETSHGDLTLLQFESLSAEPGLAHAVTTRPGNCAPHRGIGRAEAIALRQQVCRILGADFAALTAPEQVHGAQPEVQDAEEVPTGGCRIHRNPVFHTSKIDIAPFDCQ